LFRNVEASEESPSTVVFTLHFAAQHFDAKRDHARALELIQEAIAHTPTLINLYVAKARIYKVPPPHHHPMKAINADIFVFPSVAACSTPVATPRPPLEWRSPASWTWPTGLFSFSPFY